MDPWPDQPPETERRLAFRILRTPAAKPLVAIATAHELVGRMTHFAKNRTVPCEGEDACPWCQEGHSRRWHGYLAAVLTDSYEHFLFEFTATASDTFKNYLVVNDTMRGCKFRSHRPNARTNGRVVISCTRLDEMKLRLPDSPNVKKILCHIWNIQYNENQPTGMLRPPFKDVGLMPDDGDGRYKPDHAK